MLLLLLLISLFRPFGGISPDELVVVVAVVDVDGFDLL